MKKNLLTFIVSVLLLTQPVFAGAYSDGDNDNGEYPKITGEILSEYTIDSLTRSKGKVREGDKKTDASLSIESDFKLHLNDNWSFNTGLELRPVEERCSQGDLCSGSPSYNMGGNGTDDYYEKEDHLERGFHWDDYGLIVEELTADFKGEDIAFGLGKFNPTFGRAFDKSRYHGIYGTIMPEEYELTEKLGGYISVLFEDAELRFNLFFDDNTDLSRSAFNDRVRDKADGGAGNTDRPDNYSITLEGSHNQFTYNVGFRHLNTRKHYERDEKAFVFGLDYLKEFDTNNLVFIPFTEIAYIDNYDGMSGRNVWYTTVSLPLLYKGWNFVLSETYKHDSESRYKDYKSYLVQASIGYKFKNGLMFDIARKNHRHVEKSSNLSSPQKKVRDFDSWGFMLSYMLKF